MGELHGNGITRISSKHIAIAAGTSGRLGLVVVPHLLQTERVHAKQESAPW